MSSKLTVAALAALLVAGQAMQPAAAASTSPSDAKVAPGKWDVTRVLCSDLLNAADDDRATAAMFYYGYLAAKNGIKVIDVTKISDNLHKVIQQCETTPKMAVTEAFRVALVRPHKK
ncbi:MAG TPA: HdeA/HdeB family chaperone [Stellaceae bacterium]|nr:HdeA/HdeB family chaperone [Stellaceae bacterium]